MNATEDSTPEETSSAETPAAAVAADRSSPGIAETNNGPQYIGIAVLATIAIAAFSFLLLNDISKSTPKPLTAEKEIPFRTPANATPYIMTEANPAPSTDQLTAQKEMALQQAALQMAIDQQKKLDQRNRSPQVVYDQSTTNEASTRSETQSGVPATTSTGAYQLTAASGETPNNVISNNGSAVPLPGAAGSSSTGQDLNLAFAAQNADRSVETAQASQLLNLHTLIAQGAMIPGILETAIESDLPGMVRAVVSENIYSFDGFELLIPEGSRLIGQYRSGLVNGQSRVFIIWTRLIRNDGVSINVGSYGTDALGRSGLAGDVNSHFFERFGSSVMLSMIDSGLQAAANANNKASTAVAVNTGNDFSNAAAIALQNSINIPPTINVDQGTRINVFVGKDLDFSKVGGIKQAEAEQPAEKQDAE